MAKRNLTRAEKMAVKDSMPSLNIDAWMMYKKYDDHYVLRHKETNAKKRVPVA